MSSQLKQHKLLNFTALGTYKNIGSDEVWFVYASIFLFSILISSYLNLILEQTIVWLIPITVIIALIRFSLNRARQIEINDKAVNEFVSENGLKYEASLGDITDSMPGSLFKIGESKQVKQVIYGNLWGYKVYLFTYEYAVRSGKSNRKYDATIVEITLPRKLPHMVIDSLVESGNGGLSTLPINFDKSQKINLEGDFYKYFSLYAPDSYGVSALTILAPDAMEALLKHAAFCDIEIIDDRLYFYWPDIPINGKSFEEKFVTVEQVLVEIGKKISKGNIFGNLTQAKVHSVTAKNGIRLKNYFNPWLYVVSFIPMVGIIIAKTDPKLVNSIGFGKVQTILMLLFYVFALGPFIYKYLKSNQLKKSLKNRFK